MRSRKFDMKRASAMGILRLALLAGIVVAVASLGLGRADRAQAQTGGDVAVTIAASKHAVKPGSTITFTITATNVGSEPAENVVVSGWLPDWFNFVASRCSSETAPVFQVVLWPVPLRTRPISRLTCFRGRVSP
jgi:uncharacterized repeat protein (TIGR01451 family)